MGCGLSKTIVFKPVNAQIEPNLFNKRLIVIGYWLLEIDGQLASAFDKCLSDKKGSLFRLPMNQ